MTATTSSIDYAPGIETFVDRCNAAMPPDFYLDPVEDQRRLYDGLMNVFPYDLPSDVSIETVAWNDGGVERRVRVYVPDDRDGRGLLVYIRGGGFVVGSLETHNSVVAELAARSRLTAVALDFRLAPEYPFPTALEDCFVSLEMLTSNPDRFGIDIDPSKVVLCGDSSGGNMVVSLAMMCRDRGGPSVAGQATISPVLDFTRWRDGGDDAPLLTGGEMEYYTACYCPDPGDAQHPLVSPLLEGSFADLPPAYIMSAEMDSLRVDGERYAELLNDNGIPVELVVEPGLVHSAMRARALSPAVEDAWSRYCAAAARLAVTA